MSIAQNRRVARARGEIDPLKLRRLLRLQKEVAEAQERFEAAIAEELADGAPLNELARQTGLAKTTLLRWAKR